MTAQIADFELLIHDIKDALASAGLSTEERQAFAIGESLSAHKPVKVVVVGEFNAGKSTLVNALCAQNLLPAGIIPTTATVNVLRHSATEDITVVRCDGSTEALPFSASALAQFTAKRGDQREISEVRIGVSSLPSEMLIFDTPGVNDLNESRAAIVYEILPQADVIIFLMDIQQPMKRSEVDFLKNRVLRSSAVKTLFVLNHLDRVSASSEVEAACEYVRRSVTAIYGEAAELLLKDGLKGLADAFTSYMQDVPIFAISAKQLLRSLTSVTSLEGDPQGLRELILGLAEPKVRLQTTWSATTAQTYRLLATLRQELGQRRTLRSMERSRVAAEAKESGQVVERSLVAVTNALETIELQRPRLAGIAREQIAAIFSEADSKVESIAKAGFTEQAIADLQQELGRKLELCTEKLNQELRSIAAKCAQQASAFAPMKTSKPIVSSESGPKEQAANDDWLAKVLNDPVYGTGVMMLAPVAAFLFGWVGFAVVALPFVARMFSSSSSHSMEHVRKGLATSRNDVTTSLLRSLNLHLDLVATASVDVLDGPQRRLQTTCLLLTSENGTSGDPESLESLETLTSRLEDRLKPYVIETSVIRLLVGRQLSPSSISTLMAGRISSQTTQTNRIVTGTLK